MDVMKFFEERNRMCSTYERCEGCPLLTTACSDIINITPQISIVEKWAKEHPRKIRQDLFLKQWPNAEMDCQGVIAIDPCDLDKTMQGPSGDCYHADCDKCRLDFWLKEVK